ncbi:helix-turn-helix domain-containing protein [Neisseria dumasiana]|uniref:Transcriptional regulator n=1 Tax=Neisseria dumasiana TaxID=1931275 RepID=A0A1X3DI23_9NEIS|nr:helix-turn-helix transcriptional regulator [Neisseria dumasiana]OSI21674.1 transcriptional regulator [Neisseria dumasiana]
MDIPNTPLKKARLAEGLTLKEVAKHVNSDTGNISRIERGKQMPSKELVSKLVDLFSSQGITEVHIIYPERFPD